MARTMSWPRVVGTASCWPTSTLMPLALIAVMLSLAGSEPVVRSAGVSTVPAGRLRAAMTTETRLADD